MLLYKNPPGFIGHLLRKHTKHNGVKGASILTFDGVGKKVVYNPFGPLSENGHTLYLGRVEEPEDEFSSEIGLFRAEKGSLSLQKILQSGFQDPFVKRIRDTLFYSHVRAYPNNGGGAYYETELHIGKDISDLTLIAVFPMTKSVRIEGLDGYIDDYAALSLRGPDMKVKINIVPLSLFDNRIDVSTLEAADPVDIELPDGVWMGVNNIYLLPKNLRKEGYPLGILGHFGYCSEPECPESEHDTNPDKNYHAFVGPYSPSTREISDLEIIATIGDIPQGKSKSPHHKGVYYPGNMFGIGDQPIEPKKALSVKPQGLGSNYVALVGARGDAEPVILISSNPFLN